MKHISSTDPPIGTHCPSKIITKEPTELMPPQETLFHGTADKDTRSVRDEGKSRKRHFALDLDAVVFGLRLSLVLTLASLFVILPHNEGADSVIPESVWVYITVCLCSYFPDTLDAASVVKKVFQRMLGTSLGAVLGLGVGFLFLNPVDDVRIRGLVLGCTVAVLSFLWGFVSVLTIDSMREYSYAVLLTAATFGIVVVPFYTDHSEDRVWAKGAWRIANVLIGCFISALGAFLVCPKSTRISIERVLESQRKRAGTTSAAVLSSAYQVFSKHVRKPASIPEIIDKKFSRKSQAGEHYDDRVHQEYMAATREFQQGISLFALLRYDPFFYFSADRQTFRVDAEVDLARNFRIQSTVILLDSIVRNERGYHFSPEQLDLIQQASIQFDSLLNVSSNGDEKVHKQARELTEILFRVREQVRVVAAELPRRWYPSSAPDDVERGQEEDCDSTIIDDCMRQLSARNGSQSMCTASASLLFLVLVEHLILRVLRLHLASPLSKTH